MAGPARVIGYQNAFSALCDRRLVQSMYGECDVLLERVLLTLHGEAHTGRRAIEWKLFRRDFARYYESEVYPLTLSRTLTPYLQKGHLDLPEFGFRVNINLSADIAGIDRTQGSEEETDTLVRLTRKFSEGATLFHSTRDKDTVREEVTAALAEFDQTFLTPSKRRRELILKEIEADEIPQLLVYNKIDLLEDVKPRIDFNDEGVPIRVWLSAQTGEGTELLLEAISKLLAKKVFAHTLCLPPASGKLRGALFNLNGVKQENFDEQGNWLLDVRIPQVDWEKLKKEQGASIEQFIVSD